VRLAALPCAALAAVPAPAAANPQAIGEALALCIEVVDAESPAPLEEAGLELVREYEMKSPQWGVIYRSPAGLGEIRAGMDVWNGEEPPEAYSCYPNLPAKNGSEVMRWQKLAAGPVLALEAEGFERQGGSPAEPLMRKCGWSWWPGKDLYASVYHHDNLDGVRVEVSDRMPTNDNCRE